MTLDQIVAEYTATNPRITSIQTTRRYLTTAAAFRRWLGRPAAFADLSPDNYGRWVRHRRDVDRVATGTVRGDAEKLLVLWRWWAERSGLPMPRVLLPPSSSHEPTTWTPGELARLEAAARACRWNVGRIPASVYWPALLGVCIDTGERITAVWSVRSEDLDLVAGRATFRRRKGGGSSIVRAISRETIRDVRALVALRPVQPFAAVQAASLYQPLRRLVLESGLPYGRTRAFHCLRKYHATDVAAQGGDATASLGHASDKTTRAHYLDRNQLATVLPRRGRTWWGWAFG